jgi:hypothetical protein
MHEVVFLPLAVTVFVTVQNESPDVPNCNLLYQILSKYFGDIVFFKIHIFSIDRSVQKCQSNNFLSWFKLIIIVD